MTSFNYSKWDNIELSDDEDDVHPNIDRESWFRMKHRSRVDREEKEEAEKKKINFEMKKTNNLIEKIIKIIENISNDDSDDELEDLDGLKAELSQLQEANKFRQDKLDSFEKNKKLNVDNMCHVVEDRTVVNPKSVENKFSESGFAIPDIDTQDSLKETLNEAPKQMQKKDISTISTGSESKSKNDEKVISEIVSKVKSPLAAPKVKPKKRTGPERESVAMLTYHEFTEKYADTCEEFMALLSLEQSKQYLLQHGDVLLQENASNYLLLASLEDEMNGYREKMKLTAKQSQMVSNIAELAKTLKSHPGNVIVPFFTRLEQKVHFDGFMVGVNDFVANIIKRSVVKKKEMDEERDREAKESGDPVELDSISLEERLGPGGLDPIEVFESLPTSLQQAFESRDTDRLKNVLKEMSLDEAEDCMKRCVDSGLWNEG